MNTTSTVVRHYARLSTVRMRADKLGIPLETSRPGGARRFEFEISPGRFHVERGAAAAMSWLDGVEYGRSFAHTLLSEAVDAVDNETVAADGEIKGSELVEWYVEWRERVCKLRGYA